jgi:DNA repair protein RadC
VSKPIGEAAFWPTGHDVWKSIRSRMTKAIVSTAAPLGIAVHDHIIVAERGHASLKGLKLI